MLRALTTISAACLLLAGVAQAEEQPARDMLHWGLTDHQSRFEWDFQSVPAHVEGHPQSLLGELGFSLNSARLDMEARGTLEDRIAHRTDQRARLLIIGFADGVREQGHARNLGLERAEAARDYLVRHLGLDRADLDVASFGDQYSQARRDQTNRQAFDRRIEVWVVGPASPMASR
jgi:outer membrane protein OmpA-like peptidoglycan-associated protein